MDSNHRSRKTTDLQSVPFGRSGTPPRYTKSLLLFAATGRRSVTFTGHPNQWPGKFGARFYRTPKYGADDGNRTRNLLITNQLLCQLSYASKQAWGTYRSFDFLARSFLSLLSGVPSNSKKVSTQDRALCKAKFSVFLKKV